MNPHRKTSVTLLMLIALAVGLPALADDPPAIPLERMPAQPAPPPTDYRIGRQDLLEIRVFGVDDLSQAVRVADDGSISMPLLGRLTVGGLTKHEVERTIADRLGVEYIHDPQVTVFVVEYESRRVAVSGAVKTPGSYQMLGRKTLLEMISMAGGLSVDMGREIIIFRRVGEGTERLQVDLDRLVFAADPALNLAVEPGDIVYIPTVEKIRIFVSGAVRTPNLYEVPRADPVTVLKAITLAGGTTDRAASKRVQIMRTDDNGARITLVVNLKRIQQGKDEDPLLRPDDIVLVPEAFF